MGTQINEKETATATIAIEAEANVNIEELASKAVEELLDTRKSNGVSNRQSKVFDLTKRIAEFNATKDYLTGIEAKKQKADLLSDLPYASKTQLQSDCDAMRGDLSGDATADNIGDNLHGGIRPLNLNRLSLCKKTGKLLGYQYSEKQAETFAKAVADWDANDKRRKEVVTDIVLREDSHVIGGTFRKPKSIATNGMYANAKFIVKPIIVVK